jgi:hypothetical protein
MAGLGHSLSLIEVELGSSCSKEPCFGGEGVRTYCILVCCPVLGHSTGVKSMWKYKECIELCTGIVKIFIYRIVNLNMEDTPG